MQMKVVVSSSQSVNGVRSCQEIKDDNQQYSLNVHKRLKAGV